MGPSGSGKTTLLNTLACRLDVATRIEGGTLRLNGRAYGAAELKQQGGYVQQDDLLAGNLTVAETLEYTAELRLPRALGKEGLQERVDEVVNQMGLDHVRSVIVGTPLKKGVSGGERKRLCVAMELLTRPNLLFLDEPTSGLDAVNALSLCRTLRELSVVREAAVVNTIHQPSSKVFALFGQLILLRAGKIVYQGQASEAHHFFEGMGYPCPPNENPAECVGSGRVISRQGEARQHARAKLRRATDVPLLCPSAQLVHRRHHPDQRGLGGRPAAKGPQAGRRVHRTCGRLGRGAGAAAAAAGDHAVGAPVPHPLQAHCHRLRPQLVAAPHAVFPVSRRRRLQCVVSSSCDINIVAASSVFRRLLVAVGTAFLHIGDTERSTVRRQPVLFFCVVNQGVFSSLVVINSFPRERMLMLRERAAGTYYASAYYLAKTGAETILSWVNPIVFAARLACKCRPRLPSHPRAATPHAGDCLFSHRPAAGSAQILHIHGIQCVSFPASLPAAD